MFDTNFTAPESQSQPQAAHSPTDSVLPSTDATTAVIGLRVLVSVKEAGIIIGKNGGVIADVRDRTQVKAGVSQVVPGTPDRILTVTGGLDNVAQALGLISDALLANPLDDSTFQYFPLKRLLPPGPEGVVTLRLLVPNAQMGTIIGKQGMRIKELQQLYNVKIVASKDFLHNSSERLVELQGSPRAIEDATQILARCLMEDWHSVTGTTYYVPSPRMTTTARRGPVNTTMPYGQQQQTSSNGVQEISTMVPFPSDMVGCLIGKAGARIQEIRKVSGAQITIAPSDDSDGTRQFTLVGSPKAIEKALNYLNQNMEREQDRRARLAEELE